MTVSDKAIIGEGLQDFFKKLGKKGLIMSENMAKNFLKTPPEILTLQPTLPQQQFLEILNM